MRLVFRRLVMSKGTGQRGLLASLSAKAGRHDEHLPILVGTKLQGTKAEFSGIS